jgi:membrane associated rhomboid family serine protease
MSKIFSFYKRQNIVVKLLFVNIAVFLILNLLLLIFFLFNSGTQFDKLLGFLAVPSNFRKLIVRFWTPLTYMFVHINFWHIFGNMLWLYFIGIILNSYLKEKDLFALYVLGGISGAIIYILAFNLFPVFSNVKIFSYAIGASASITAIVIALATLKPDEPVYLYGLFKIKMLYIGIFMLVYDLFLLKSSNAGGHFAHLGGAIYGFVFAYYYKRGTNIQAGFANFLSKIFRIDFTPKSKFKVIKNNLRSKDDFTANQTKREIQIEIDRILSKISQYGYQSLSRKEKEFLKKYSNRY